MNNSNKTEFEIKCVVNQKVEIEHYFISFDEWDHLKNLISNIKWGFNFPLAIGSSFIGIALSIIVEIFINKSIANFTIRFILLLCAIIFSAFFICWGIIKEKKIIIKAQNIIDFMKLIEKRINKNNHVQSSVNAVKKVDSKI